MIRLVLFLGVHSAHHPARAARAPDRVAGEGGYKIGYALVSVAGLALIVWGFAHYRAAGMWRGLDFRRRH